MQCNVIVHVYKFACACVFSHKPHSLHESVVIRLSSNDNKGYNPPINVTVAAACDSEGDHNPPMNVTVTAAHGLERDCQCNPWAMTGLKKAAAQSIWESNSGLIYERY